MSELALRLLRHSLIEHALETGNKARFMQLTGRRWRQHVVTKDEISPDSPRVNTKEEK